jgi:hypothetical protein
MKNPLQISFKISYIIPIVVLNVSAFGFIIYSLFGGATSVGGLHNICIYSSNSVACKAYTQEHNTKLADFCNEFLSSAYNYNNSTDSDGNVIYGELWETNEEKVEEYGIRFSDGKVIPDKGDYYRIVNGQRLEYDHTDKNVGYLCIAPFKGGYVSDRLEKMEKDKSDEYNRNSTIQVVLARCSLIVVMIDILLISKILFMKFYTKNIINQKLWKKTQKKSL